MCLRVRPEPRRAGAERGPGTWTFDLAGAKSAGSSSACISNGFNSARFRQSTTYLCGITGQPGDLLQPRILANQAILALGDASREMRTR
jgi:hypothetical protein